MPRESIPPLTISAFSDEVQEIMTRIPHWLLRWGNTLIAAIMAILLFITWMIRYPDLITEPVTLTGSTPPAEVVARQSGHLAKLFVQPNAVVSRGDILAIIESPVDYEGALEIRKEVEAVLSTFSQQEKLGPLPIQNSRQLGKLQMSFSEFSMEYETFRTLLQEDFAVKTVALLEEQLARKRKQVSNIIQQADAIEREVELARLKYERIKALNARDSVSISQLQEEEAALLGIQRQQASIDSLLNDEQIAVAELQKQINDLLHRRSEALRDAKIRVQEAAKRVLSEIEIWESDYVLRAPIAGNVAFYDYWSDQQFVSNGSQVFMIDPGSTQLIGRIQVKSTGAGKISAGNQVRIKLNDYPYKEFGIVSGTVRSLSLVAKEGGHMVLVDIPFPLKTSYQKEIPFKQEMVGEANIITNDRRLIERIFSELLRAFNQSASFQAG